jgi:hypothetical protein
VESVPNDSYDPRSRGWYKAAEAEPGVQWSNVYIFFTDRTPGITASVAVMPHGRPVAVIGAYIYLNSLSTFLQQLQGRVRGVLAIVNGDGQVVAFDDPKHVMTDGADGPHPHNVQELGNKALAEAFDRVRVEGPTSALVTIDGQRHVFGAASLRSAVGRHWWLMLLAPEDAYLGFVSANSRRGMVAASAVILLALALAGFLTWPAELAGRSAMLRNDARAAVAEFEAAATLRRDQRDYAGMARVLAAAGAAAEGAGNGGAAADYCYRAGRSAAVQREGEKARTWLRKALGLAGQHNMPSVAGDSRRLLQTLDQPR